jgi:SAM-dependent methyltransferase
MCTDLHDKLLKKANKTAFTNEFQVENAENLSFQNEQFDFVLCKESFHHFPRPHIALHEMLRVANIGVILIEPNDPIINKKFTPFLSIIKKLLGKKSVGSHHNFEPVGNYVFSISNRELEKIQLGMHRRYIAFKYINDYYEPGFEFISLDSKIFSEQKKIKTTKFIIKLRDLLTQYGLISPGILASILFKSEPNPSLLSNLKKIGWKIKVLPRNPYL